ncbi:hypothetical protein EMCRGX_G005642 [Ephydatia muelleri]
MTWESATVGDNGPREEVLPNCELGDILDWDVQPSSPLPGTEVDQRAQGTGWPFSPISPTQMDYSTAATPRETGDPLLQNTPDPEQDRGWMDSQNSGKGKLPLGKRGTNKGQVRGEPKSQTGHAGRGRIGCRAIPGRSKGEVMDRAHQVEDNPLVEGKGTGQDRDIHRMIVEMISTSELTDWQKLDAIYCFAKPRLVYLQQNQLPSTGWAKALNKKVKDLIKANLKLPKYEIHIYRVSTAYRLLLVLSNDPVVRDTALSALGDTAKWKSWWPPSTCHQGLSPSLAGSLDHSRSTSLQGYEVSPPHSTSDEMEECQGPRQDSPMCVRTPSQQPLDPWGKIYLFQRVTVCAQYANLLPTRMVRKRSSEPIQDTSCPKCHEEQETLAHVINHSPPHVCLVRATHNNILHRLAKAVPTSKRSLHTYFSNRLYMALKPGLVIYNQPNQRPML